MKWQKRFLELAQHISTFSKDPSTKVGAVIFDDNNRVISMGYNGLPQKISDTDQRYDNRELKYKIIIHAEMNAILFSKKDLTNCSIATWPFLSCSNCTSAIIQAGIKRIISPKLPVELEKRWKESCDLSLDLYREANVEVILL
jgi:dCMP deaminase